MPHHYKVIILQLKKNEQWEEKEFSSNRPHLFLIIQISKVETEKCTADFEDISFKISNSRGKWFLHLLVDWVFQIEFNIYFRSGILSMSFFSNPYCFLQIYYSFNIWNKPRHLGIIRLKKKITVVLLTRQS